MEACMSAAPARTSTPLPLFCTRTRVSTREPAPEPDVLTETPVPPLLTMSVSLMTTSAPSCMLTAGPVNCSMTQFSTKTELPVPAMIADEPEAAPLPTIFRLRIRRMPEPSEKPVKFGLYTPPGQSIVIDLLKRTFPPYGPLSRQSTSPPGSVTPPAPKNVAQGCARVHGLASLPDEATNVTGAAEPGVVVEMKMNNAATTVPSRKQVVLVTAVLLVGG